MKNLSYILIVSCIIGCSSKPPPAPPEMVIRVEQTPDGVADYVWEEPMVDAVDVPPGLDPDGIYYRPGHKEIVEIRQGRWKMHQGRKQPPAQAASDSDDCAGDCEQK